MLLVHRRESIADLGYSNDCLAMFESEFDGVRILTDVGVAAGEECVRPAVSRAQVGF